MASRGYHKRDATFDASTEFQNYANLFDEETRELLQKNNEPSNQAAAPLHSLPAEPNYQPPLVNADEKEQIMKYHALRVIEIDDDNNSNNNQYTDDAAVQSIMADASDRHFRKWQMSRRHTLDELERKGVIDPNFFNFTDQQQQQQPQSQQPQPQPPQNTSSTNSTNALHVNMNAQVHASSTRAQRGSPDDHQDHDHDHDHDDGDDGLPMQQTLMVPSNSVISSVSNLEDNDDDYDCDDTELHKHDLYYVLCHQIIPKSQQNVFQQMVQQNLVYNLNNPLHRGGGNSGNGNGNSSGSGGDGDELSAPTSADVSVMDDEMMIDVSAVRALNDDQPKNARAPPPTAIGTPAMMHGLDDTLDGEDGDENRVTPYAHSKKHTDIAKVKSKLERHSQKLEKEKMRHLLDEVGGDVHEALLSDSSDGGHVPGADDDDEDDDEEPQVQQLPYANGHGGNATANMQNMQNVNGNKQSMHMGNQRSIMSLMQNHYQNGGADGAGAHTAAAEYNNSFSFAPMTIREQANPFLDDSTTNTAAAARIAQSKTPKYERSALFDKQNAYNISYYCIPRNIDGGMLSSSIFLAYKQWCESSIIRYTEQAGMCLDQMKKESNMLEYLHRETILKTPAENLYDDHAQTLYEDDDDDDGFPWMNGHGSAGAAVGGGGGGLLLDLPDDIDDHHDGSGNGSGSGGGGKGLELRLKREQHLKKLSQIDDNLADVRDKLRKMFRVQQHIQFLQQQYDTHIERIREDKTELLEILQELRDRHRDCDAIASSIRHLEEWLIPNFTYSIAAERAEEVDSFNRRIKQLEHANTNHEQKRKYSSIVEETQHFIGELHHLIQRLQRISENKQNEVDRLSASIAQMRSQNAILVNATQHSYRTVTSRLFELQTHYKLPNILDSTTDARGASEAVTASLSAYLKRVECRDYYNRALELYQAAIIYSDERTKVFYNAFMFAVNAVLIDCMVVDEYIATNTAAYTASGGGGTAGGGGGGVHETMMSFAQQQQHQNTQLSLALSDTPEQKENAADKTVGFKIAHSMKQSTDQILNDAFTPVSLEASTFSTFYPLQNEYEHDLIKDTQNDPHKLLQHIVEHNEFDVEFETLQWLQRLEVNMVRKTQHLNGDVNAKDKNSLLHRLKSISLFGHLLPYRDNVMVCVAQHLTLKYQQQIFALNYDKLKIKEYAQQHCCILLANVLFTNTNKRGLVRRIKKLCREKRKQQTQSTANASEERNDRNNPFDLNVYRMAALILRNIYNIAIPFPM